MANDKTFAGIDVGTTMTKAAIVDSDGKLLGSYVQRSGTDLAAAAIVAFEEAMTRAGVTRDGVQAIVSTGYGRRSVPFDRLACARTTGAGRAGSFAWDTRTEIGCHGRGCYHYYPEEITIVDIGGQDNKVIRLDAEGKRIRFKMNRKCAAGTGAFLEEMAYKLGIPIDDLNDLAQAASEAASIGSYCTVFTATEVLDRIRAGERTDNIIRGLFDSVVKRILEMDTLNGWVIMTGGVVAYNTIVAELLSTRVEARVVVAPHPQEMGAFGAALLARELPGVET